MLKSSFVERCASVADVGFDRGDEFFNAVKRNHGAQALHKLHR